MRTIAQIFMDFSEKLNFMKAIGISWWQFEARKKAKKCCQVGQIGCPILLVVLKALKIFEMLVKTFL